MYLSLHSFLMRSDPERWYSILISAKHEFEFDVTLQNYGVKPINLLINHLLYLMSLWVRA